VRRTGWTVESRVFPLLAPIAMWAPALGSYVARRTVDREFTSTLPLREWGRTGAQVILRPLLFPLVAYGASYAIALSAGFAHWSPGGGKWTTTRQIGANVVVNLTTLGVVGTFTARRGVVSVDAATRRVVAVADAAFARLKPRAPF